VHRISPRTRMDVLVIYKDTLSTKSPAELVNETLGPLLIGFTISAALFGVTCAQGCLYFNRHSQDSTQLKSIVIALLLLETFQIALVTHAIFVYTISDHGDLDGLNDTVWSILIQALPSTLIVSIVQYVWIMRIRHLSQSNRRTQVAVCMLSSVFIEMGTSITLIAIGCKFPGWGDFGHELGPAIACLALRTFNEMLVTGLLCYHLQRAKNGLRQTDGIIQTMMWYGLRAGLLNCMGSVALMAMLTIQSAWPFYNGAYIVFARLYTNSLLAMLNWRRSQKTPEIAGLKASEPEAIELSTVRWGLSTSSYAMRLTIPELENM